MEHVTVPWVISVSDTSPGKASFRYGDTTATETFIVPWDSHATFVQQVLGGATRLGLDNIRIKRSLPAQHPYYQYLYAVQAEVQGRGLGGSSPTLPSSLAGKRIGPRAPYMAYKTAHVTVTFSTLPYAVLEDTAIEAQREWQRFVSWEFKPDAETITRRGRTYMFADGPPSIVGRYFNYDRRITASRKGKLTINWYRVPETWIFNAGGQTPNLTYGVGYVNDNPWPDPTNGFPRGTLLYDSFELHAETSPCPAGARGVLFNAVPRSYRVTLNMLYFDPWVDPSYNTYRGHNLMPPAPTITDDGSTWSYAYLATVGGTLAGATLHGYYNFDGIFAGAL